MHGVVSESFLTEVLPIYTDTSERTSRGWELKHNGSGWSTLCSGVTINTTPCSDNTITVQMHWLYQIKHAKIRSLLQTSMNLQTNIQDHQIKMSQTQIVISNPWQDGEKQNSSPPPLLYRVENYSRHRLYHFHNAEGCSAVQLCINTRGSRTKVSFPDC